MKIQFINLQNTCPLLFHLLHYDGCSGYLLVLITLRLNSHFWNATWCLPLTVDAVKFRYLLSVTLNRWIRIHDLDLDHQLYQPEASNLQGVSQITRGVQNFLLWLQHCHPVSTGHGSHLSSTGSQDPGSCLLALLLFVSDFFQCKFLYAVSLPIFLSVWWATKNILFEFLSYLC